ncbi:hypothetical protein JVU11DRAFT_617 [Chiua virens]|nr:hypothetical protein JVU11DRAFT_617 [Chiua virens]
MTAQHRLASTDTHNIPKFELEDEFSVVQADACGRWFRLDQNVGDRAVLLMLLENTQAMAPDLRRKVDANRAARMAQERVLKQEIEAQASLFIILLSF